MTTTKRPHDDFFKLLLSMKEVIRDLTCNALEKEVAEQIDLDSLRLDPTDYRDEQLAGLFSDVVYECRFKDADVTLNISILWEHKSKFKAGVKFQLLNYMVEIWRTQQRQKKANNLVLSIVFSQDPRGWQDDGHEPLFPDLPEILQPFAPGFRYIVIDLSQYSDEEIDKLFDTVQLRTSLHVMKHIKDPDFPEEISSIFRELDKLIEQENGVSLFAAIYTYLYNARKNKDEELSLIHI